jgi:hypothetical protein
MKKATKKAPAAKVPAAKVPAAKVPAAATTDATRKIKVLVAENPKRGKSRDRFALHRTGSTVAQYVARSVKAGNAASLAMADIRWDVAKKLIAVG